MPEATALHVCTLSHQMKLPSAGSASPPQPAVQDASLQPAGSSHEELSDFILRGSDLAPACSV